ncbi:MAG: aminotransferase class V-fold PLP-dependent enzyme [Planctomycetota bacterium]
MTPLSEGADAFVIEAGHVYLNGASIGPRLRTVHEAGQRALERCARPWELDQETWFDDANAIRPMAAELFGARPHEMAFVPSVSYGMETAARNLPLEHGQSVVCLDRQFPSNHYPWRRKADAVVADVVTVPTPSDSDWTSATLEHVETRTAIVAVPNVHWADGARLDLHRIGARCREVGAALVLDLTQSVGVLPTDLGAIDADFAVAAGYKWILGPYGCGFLFAAERHHTGEPIDPNWITRVGSNRFDKIAVYTDEYQPGALRFDAGEYTNYILLPMMKAALATTTAWSRAGLAESLGDITRGLADVAAAFDWTGTAGEHASPHIIGLEHPTIDARQAAVALHDHGVKVSARDGKLRLSPHLNAAGEQTISAFRSALASIS